VHPLIPRQSVHEPDGRRPAHLDDEAGLSAELAAVVSGARRRAVRDGDRQVDTAHLLHSLLESGVEVRTVFGGEAQLARLMGYLVQRSIGYGLRWQGSVEDSGAVPVVIRAEGFSPLAAGAMAYARARAADRGGPARATDLLAAIVADPQARAVEVLGRAGIAAHEVLARVNGRAGRSV
jgi:hypothetical protein